MTFKRWVIDLSNVQKSHVGVQKPVCLLLSVLVDPSQ